MLLLYHFQLLSSHLLPLGFSQSLLLVLRHDLVHGRVEQPPEEENHQVAEECIEEIASGGAKLRQCFIYPAPMIVKLGINHDKDLL